MTKSLHLNYGLVCRACILLYTIFKYKVKEHGKIRIYDLENLVLLCIGKQNALDFNLWVPLHMWCIFHTSWGFINLLYKAPELRYQQNRRKTNMSG